MNLASDYKRQFAWRAWTSVLNALPPLQDQIVLDLGCAVGDQAAELVDRGAKVIGVDRNWELLREAEARRLANAEFRKADLRALPVFENPVDGIWCSFTAAYLPDLCSVLTSWSSCLRPGGWIALTEIDNLFGHEPISDRTRLMLKKYAQEALASCRYDFHMGRKLRKYLERSEFLRALQHPKHHSLAKVYCCIATKQG